MGVKDFTELICWQLARELKQFIYELTSRPKVAKDKEFCEEAIEAARSGPKNIAEGFGRFNNKEFAQFVKIAIGSEQETRNNILDAFDAGYVNEAERDAGLLLSKRAISAAIKFREYLLSDRNPYKEKRTRETDA